MTPNIQHSFIHAEHAVRMQIMQHSCKSCSIHASHAACMQTMQRSFKTCSVHALFMQNMQHSCKSCSIHAACMQTMQHSCSVHSKHVAFMHCSCKICSVHAKHAAIMQRSCKTCSIHAEHFKSIDPQVQLARCPPCRCSIEFLSKLGSVCVHYSGSFKSRKCSTQHYERKRTSMPWRHNLTPQP